jgi:hypothetical protein
MKHTFKEEQRFTQWWLWLGLIAIGLLPTYGIYIQLIMGQKFGDKPMSDLGLIVFAICIFAFIAFFWLLKLSTEIDQDEININFFPLSKKQFKWQDVKSAGLVDYGFVGYGIRYGSKYGTVYNTSGRNGLAIELKNGKKYVIGTQKEEELNKLIPTVRERHGISKIDNK